MRVDFSRCHLDGGDVSETDVCGSCPRLPPTFIRRGCAEYVRRRRRELAAPRARLRRRPYHDRMTERC